MVGLGVCALSPAATADDAAPPDIPVVGAPGSDAETAPAVEATGPVAPAVPATPSDAPEPAPAPPAAPSPPGPAVPAPAPPLSPAPPVAEASAAALAAVAAADEAARSLDYETAIQELERAVAAGLPPDQVMLIRRRMVLYERYLGMTALLDLARENPGRLVGGGTTRGGTQLWGLLQVVELGCVDGGGIGNRLRDQGALAVRTADGQVRSVPARAIAQVRIGWLPPGPATRPFWSIGSLELLLQSGEIVTGTPTWALPMSSFWVRPPDATEDLNASAFPAMGKNLRPEDLMAEIIIIGAPPAAPAALPAAPATAAGGPTFPSAGPALPAAAPTGSSGPAPESTTTGAPPADTAAAAPAAAPPTPTEQPTASADSTPQEVTP